MWLGVEFVFVFPHGRVEQHLRQRSRILVTACLKLLAMYRRRQHDWSMVGGELRYRQVAKMGRTLQIGHLDHWPLGPLAAAGQRISVGTVQLTTRKARRQVPILISPRSLFSLDPRVARQTRSRPLCESSLFLCATEYDSFSLLTFFF